MKSYEEIIKEWQIEIITLTNPNSSVRARINIDLKKPPITIKGFTLGDKKDGEPFVSPPRYKNNYGKWCSIVFLPMDLLKVLTGYVLNEIGEAGYASIGGSPEATGSIPETSEEEIDIHSVPF